MTVRMKLDKKTGRRVATSPPRWDPPEVLYRGFFFLVGIGSAFGVGAGTITLGRHHNWWGAVSCFIVSSFFFVVSMAALMDAW